MTFSIVACDDAHLGVATASHWVAVGSLVPWARAGVGAIATQAFTAASYGIEGLGRLAAGAPPEDALAELLDLDTRSESRQVAMMDVEGRVATHTGSGCSPRVSRAHTDGAVALGNMLAASDIAARMISAWTSSDGPLAARLLAALTAGDAAGGDARGRQSAAMLVVERRGTHAPGAGVIVDVRVDDHASPLTELRRLIELQAAYARVSAAAFDDPLTVDTDQLESELGGTADREARTWLALELLNRGDGDGAGEVLSELPHLRDLVELWRQSRDSADPQSG